MSAIRRSSVSPLPPGERPCISALGPDVAIEWGFNLYLADNTAETTEVGRSARRALREFERFVVRFPEHSPERLYLAKLRMAATSFARGIARRKEALASRLEAAREAKQSRILAFAHGERLAGFVKGGLQLLLLGGFSYALVRALLLLPFLGAHVAGFEPQYASLATALGSTLLGSFLKSWFLNRRVHHVFAGFEDELRRADREYAESVIREYELAAQFAFHSWTQLTDEPAPMTAAFQNLLLSVMGREETYHR